MASLCGIVIGRAALLSVWPRNALAALDRAASNRASYTVSSASSLPLAPHVPLSDDRQTVPGVAQSRRAVARRKMLKAAPSGLLGLNAASGLVTLIVGFLMIGCLFGSLELNRSAKLETAMRQADLARTRDTDNLTELSQATARLAAALPLRWDDAEAHQHLALSLIAQYQAQVYEQLRLTPTSDRPQGDDATIESEPNEERDAELWPSVDTSSSSHVA